MDDLYKRQLAVAKKREELARPIWEQESKELPGTWVAIKNAPSRAGGESGEDDCSAYIETKYQEFCSDSRKFRARVDTTAASGRAMKLSLDFSKMSTKEANGRESAVWRIRRLESRSEAAEPPAARVPPAPPVSSLPRTPVATAEPMTASASTPEDESLPPCRFGAKCQNTNPSHLEAFSHPPKAPEPEADGRSTSGAAAPVPPPDVAPAVSRSSSAPPTLSAVSTLPPVATPVTSAVGVPHGGAATVAELLAKDECLPKDGLSPVAPVASKGSEATPQCTDAVLKACRSFDPRAQESLKRPGQCQYVAPITADKSVKEKRGFLANLCGKKDKCLNRHLFRRSPVNWSSYQPGERSVLVIGPGTEGNAQVFKDLRQDGWEVTIVGGGDYDKDPALKPPGWDKGTPNLACNNGMNLSSFADCIVAPRIAELIKAGKGPAVVIAGSRGGEVTIPRLWAFGYKGPTIVINAGCLKAAEIPGQPVRLALITGGQDTLQTKDIVQTGSLICKQDPQRPVLLHHDPNEQHTHSNQSLTETLESLLWAVISESAFLSATEKIRNNQPFNEAATARGVLLRAF